jgi:hypothetical protein
MIAKADFGRENWPLSVNWRAGVLTYLMDKPTVEAWRQVRHQDPTDQESSG